LSVRLVERVDEEDQARVDDDDRGVAEGRAERANVRTGTVGAA
jgi:hypothetical protein